MMPVPIELDKVRHIRYPWRAIVDMEKSTKRGLPQVMLTPGVDSLIHLLLAGLKTEDPDLTYDKAGDLLQDYLDNGGTVRDIENAIIEGLKSGGWVRESPNPTGG